MKRTFDRYISDDMENDIEKINQKNKINIQILDYLLDEKINNQVEIWNEFNDLMGKLGFEYNRSSLNKIVSNEVIIITLKLLNKHKLLNNAANLNVKFRNLGSNIRIVNYNFNNGDKRDYDIIEL